MNRNYKGNLKEWNKLFACSNIDEEVIAEGEHKTAQFLFSTLRSIKSSCLSAPVIRSSYLLRLKAMECAAYSKKSVKYCQFCYQPWSEGCFTLKVLPQKVPGKCVKKIMKKKLRDPSKLSKYGKNILKKIEKNKGNKLVLKCLKCRKQTVRMMVKLSPKKKSPENKLEKAKKKNKCKIKDNFAGLNSQAVMNASLFEEKFNAANLLKKEKHRRKFPDRMAGSFHEKKELEREEKVKERELLDYQRNRKRAQIIDSFSKAPTTAFNNLKDLFRDFKKTYNSKTNENRGKKENEKLTNILHPQLSIKKGRRKKGKQAVN